MAGMNPILVEAMRGGIRESAHRGAIAVVDADGSAVASLGDIERPVFPRSAVKVLQALPLVASGAADQLGLGDEELAVACASHNGEPEHTARRRPACWRAPGSTPTRSNAARTGRIASRSSGRWRPRASSRAPCTTTARASTPAFSASPAAWPKAPTCAATRRATSARSIR